MKKVLVAGSTGYLGQYIVKQLKNQGYWVRALTRDPKKLDHLRDYMDEVYVGEITKIESITEVCHDVDYIISSIGITRQKDGLSYMDVDYSANKNLLDLAVKNKIQKFIYVSVFNAHLLQDLQIIAAKEKFVDALRKSGLEYSIIRPTGFFSDMLDFLDMAKKGRIYLFGRGENRLNPIHGQDLAEVCVQALENSANEVNIGGPTVFSFKEIAELAFTVLNKPVKISFLPVWVKKLLIKSIKTFSSAKTYGPVEFLLTAITMDGLAPVHGKEQLKDFFKLSAV